MSANNFILIRQYKKDKYSVSVKDIETLSGKTIKLFKNVEDAIRFANTILDYGDIEYGLQIKLLDKKETIG